MIATTSESACASAPVTLNRRDFVMYVRGRPITLTRTQFSIVAYLVENADRWATPRELIRQVLGTHHRPDTSLIRVHVHAIRRRLGGDAVWLESDPCRSRGYRWRTRAPAHRGAMTAAFPATRY